MILVDSSVFIQVQRLPNSNEAIELAALLTSGEVAVTGAVMMECIRVARSAAQLEFLIDTFLSFHYLDMDQQTWVIASRLNNRLLRDGNTMSDFDIAIAATAIRHDVPLYTLDTDFNRVPELSLYEPTQSQKQR